MVQQVEAPSTKPDNLRSIPGSMWLEEGTKAGKLSFDQALTMLWYRSTYAHPPQTKAKRKHLKSTPPQESSGLFFIRTCLLKSAEDPIRAQREKVMLF